METEATNPTHKKTSKAWLIKALFWALSMMAVDFLLIPYLNNTASLSTGYFFIATPLWLLLALLLAFLSRLFGSKKS